MNSKQIEKNLDELAEVLQQFQVPSAQFHLLIAGGAYMLIQKKRQFTEDIDFAIIQQPSRIPRNRVFQVTIERTEIAQARTTVPFSAEFKQAVQIIAQRHPELAEDWLNDEAASYYYDDAPLPEVTFWQSFQGILYCYLPTKEYMFATKIAASRPKDVNDIQVLMRDLKIKNRAQAKQIIDRFLLPEAQVFWQVDDQLDLLFP
ncbi:hypothetical protein [Dictyobacter formicarum]|uniref:Nucleotidyl transferase AbiEii toxin, Type IV TA system n=1 Tax=Dictyobacter formicarum TaxID=2778368 RepID=A0ABQ3VPF3_9CHLR|nr:hypothetical protein [Dictyobacter formicarum]GHO87561.1 hypothetical protein KSZ_55670 [Dictyobacter formicarum]